MVRPLRSVLVGDVDFYPSEYAFGVNQAMTRAGHWHSSVNIRWDAGVIAKRLAEVQPDVIWGHMLLWAPRGADGVSITPDLLEMCSEWRVRGARVLLHDGDARADTRFPVDISPAVDVALCNHTADRSAWGVRQVHWPYFAFDQERPAPPSEEFRCDLAFAGRLDDRPLYAERTALVGVLKERLGDRMRVFPTTRVPHTLFRTPELASSAGAVLGYGRPEALGWVDVRAFQYPGAGGVLLYDDADGLLRYDPGMLPYRTFVPYEHERGSADSVVDALERMKRDDLPWERGSQSPRSVAELREEAFVYSQSKHSATARVRQALAAVGLVL